MKKLMLLALAAALTTATVPTFAQDKEKCNKECCKKCPEKGTAKKGCCKKQA